MSIEVNSALFRSISFFKGDMAGQLIKTFKKKSPHHCRWYEFYPSIFSKG
jgi:hypothetical protein